MSLASAKRMLQWKVITEALAECELDPELIALVDQARAIQETVLMVASSLIGGADQKQIKNYIKVEMVGMTPPFDRAYVELHKPGGKTSHELRELLRDRLTHIRRCLMDGPPQDAFLRGMILGIEETLELEAP